MKIAVAGTGYVGASVYEKTNGEAAKRGMMTEKLSMTLAIS